MKTIQRIINGDSRQMNLLADKSVHLIITSPPYWQLKDYGTENQIGFHDSYESYINNLNLVWSECNRVLHDGCRLCINIGDQFARSVYYGRYKVIPIRTEIIKFCESIGLDYMGAIIWQKQTTMNTTGGGAVMGSFPYPRNGILKIDYEFILIFKKQGNSPKPTLEQKKLSEMTKEEWNTYFSSHWTFGGAKQDGHIAVFPEELPARLIKMFSFAGETVFDPFMGSGTTALAAKKLQRNSIGYEINPEFIPFYKSKLNVGQADLSGTEYILQKDNLVQDNEEKIAQLPYIFSDPHKLDKKIDIKKLQFGSKIDKDSGDREEYYTVKNVITPYLIELNNNLKIRLIGIKEKSSVNGEANKWLTEKLKGQKVFMKYDQVKYDDNNNLFCYLYLKNRTFVNAHLLKAGLVDVDSTIDFKYKNKFSEII
jgi:DNA modification methylase